MKINYSNSFNDYYEYNIFKFNKFNRLKKQKCILVSFLLFCIVLAFLFEYNGYLNKDEALKSTFFAISLMIVIILFLGNILINLFKIDFKLAEKKNLGLLGKKQIEIKEGMLIYTQSTGKTFEYNLNDIEEIIENKEYIYIILRNKNSYIDTPIIKNSSFNNSNERANFISLILKK